MFSSERLTEWHVHIFSSCLSAPPHSNGMYLEELHRNQRWLQRFLQAGFDSKSRLQTQRQKSRCCGGCLFSKKLPLLRKNFRTVLRRISFWSKKTTPPMFKPMFQWHDLLSRSLIKGGIPTIRDNSPPYFPLIRNIKQIFSSHHASSEQKYDSNR